MAFEKPSEFGDRPAGLRTAQYVRVSSDMQKSLQNQSDAIAAYAGQRGLVVVRTYSNKDPVIGVARYIIARGVAAYERRRWPTVRTRALE
jgi:predicted site-specific integrase-resolvase